MVIKIIDLDHDHESNCLSCQVAGSALDEKLSGVRAKIALFSSDTKQCSSVKLGKYQSSEDVGKLGAGTAGMTRAHTHSDVRYDETGVKRQTKTQERLTKDQAPHSNTGLKPQNKSSLSSTAQFRSMINVSSNQVSRLS